jgi:rare lipoprotein A
MSEAHRAPSMTRSAAEQARKQRAKKQAARLKTERHAMSGIASRYSDRFQGRRTANGERYDRRSYTAAHKTLPFGTHVKITSKLNKRSVVVRINDRGPYARGRVLDLSDVAACGFNASAVHLTVRRTRHSPMNTPLDIAVQPAQVWVN